MFALYMQLLLCQVICGGLRGNSFSSGHSIILRFYTDTGIKHDSMCIRKIHEVTAFAMWSFPPAGIDAAVFRFPVLSTKQCVDIAAMWTQCMQLELSQHRQHSFGGVLQESKPPWFDEMHRPTLGPCCITYIRLLYISCKVMFTTQSCTARVQLCHYCSV